MRHRTRTRNAGRRLLGPGGGWTPAALPALTLWYTAGPAWCFADAAKAVPCGDGDAVYAWADRSAGKSDLAQSNAALRPILRLVGGKWKVVFDGTDDTMAAAPTVPAAFCLGLALACPFDGSDRQAAAFDWPGFVAGAGGASGLFYNGGWVGTPTDCAAGAAVVYAAHAPAADVYKNGVKVGNALTYSGGPYAAFTVGVQQVSAPLNGSVGGIVVTGSVPSTPDLAQLGSYLLGLL